MEMMQNNHDNAASVGAEMQCRGVGARVCPARGTGVH